MTIPYKKTPKPSVNYLSLDGIRAVLAQPDPSTRNGLRNLTMLSLLYDTGARVQEIVDITWDDIQFDKSAYVKLTGNGNKTRLVPLMSKTVQMIKNYSRKIPLNIHEPIFCNNVGQKFTRAGVSYVLQKYVQQAQIAFPEHVPQIVTPHCIPHSKAMHLLQAGVNLIYIRDLLGHTNITTTEIYARTDTQAKRIALENAYKKLAPSVGTSWNDDKNLMSWLKDLGR